MPAFYMIFARKKIFFLTFGGMERRGRCPLPRLLRQ